jgi:hypothetical protein
MVAEVRVNEGARVGVIGVDLRARGTMVPMSRSAAAGRQACRGRAPVDSRRYDGQHGGRPGKPSDTGTRRKPCLPLRPDPMMAVFGHGEAPVRTICQNAVRKAPPRLAPRATGLYPPSTEQFRQFECPWSLRRTRSSRINRPDTLPFRPITGDWSAVVVGSRMTAPDGCRGCAGAGRPDRRVSQRDA